MAELTRAELKAAVEKEPCHCDSGLICDRCDWLEEMSQEEHEHNG